MAAGTAMATATATPVTTGGAARASPAGGSEACQLGNICQLVRAAGKEAGRPQGCDSALMWAALSRAASSEKPSLKGRGSGDDSGLRPLLAGHTDALLKAPSGCG